MDISKFIDILIYYILIESMRPTIAIIQLVVGYNAVRTVFQC